MTSLKPSTTISTDNKALFDTSSFLDTTRPNLARIFDYLSGGGTHFEADRVAAHTMWSRFPPLKKWIQLREAFVFEAIQVLYKQGLRQFLDLGSGMPNNDAVHRLVPKASFVYSDINPIAVSFGTSLFSDLDHIVYAYGDARHLPSLLSRSEVTSTLDSNQKTAIGLNNLLLFLQEEELSLAAQQLFEWATVGSEIFVFLQSQKDDIENVELYHQFESQFQQVGLPIRFNRLTSILKQFSPWRVKRLEPIPLFLGLPATFLDHADGIDVGMQYHALFLIKE
ncbi:MAG: SAM-dependent methyltransferase [Chloroflexota bacterium]